MAEDDRRFEKGFYSEHRLPVADRYARLTSRRRLFAMGGVAALALAALFAADAFLGRGAAIVSAPLTDSHALFGGDCASCHTPLRGATDASCLGCHQQSGSELGVYTYDRHYMYRSGVPDRSAPDSEEVGCAGCHREHEGREASLRQVADARCVGCHEMESFAEGHPEFQFAREGTPDDANLRFAHVAHVREVMAEESLVEVEAACLACHTPAADGRSFEPISFEGSCDGCHISRSDATGRVPVEAGSGPGVATLAGIRESGGAGAEWAYFWNPDEFSERGGTVQKRPVYHADPWVLHNLRKLRRDLYPGAELADLLSTTPEVPPDQVRALHREAMATLRTQIEALRGDPSPDVQREIERLSGMLAEVERRIEDPYASLDATRFDVGIADQAPGVASGAIDVGAYETTIDSLTRTCQTCHVVERATIRRVEADEGGFPRAEFDHRAHVIHARCLDCHTAIPVRELLLSGEDAPPESDHAGVVNLPTRETCQSCHSNKAAPADCTSCHLFHPDTSHWATLSR